MVTISTMLSDLQNHIAAWEGVHVEPHRFGGTEFKIGNVEIGHFHRNGMVDIPFTRAIRDVLIAEGTAGYHHLLHDSGWITFYIRSEQDAGNALRLFRLSYLQKYGRRGGMEGAAVLADLGALNASDALRGLIAKFSE